MPIQGSSRSVLFAVLLIGVSLAAPAGFAQTVTTIMHANIVRPERNAVDADQTIVVIGTRIAQTGPAATLAAPPGSNIIDAGGAYVMPGLAEMHAHVPHHQKGEAYLNDVLFLWVANGVTTIRGMNGEPEHLELRDRIERQETLGPRLLTAGPPFTGSKVKKSEQATQRVVAQAKAGYDFIKVHMGISRAVYDAVAQAAQAQGIPFAGHVAQDVGLGRALEVHQATIDHLDSYMPALVGADADTGDTEYGLLGAPLTPFVDRQRFIVVARETAEAAVWNVPTLSMAEKFMGPVDVSAPGLRYMPPRMVRGWVAAARGFQATSVADPAAAQRFLEYRKLLVKTLHDVGAGLLLGSDAPQILNVPGFSIHDELGLMVDAGLTPAEALTTGTLNPARFFGMEDVFGRVVAGLEADLILVSENPLEQIETLRAPLGVMVRGRWLSAEALGAGLEQIVRRNLESRP